MAEVNTSGRKAKDLVPIAKPPPRGAASEGTVSAAVASDLAGINNGNTGRTPRAGDFPDPGTGSRINAASVESAEGEKARIQSGYPQEEQDYLIDRMENLTGRYLGNARSANQQMANYPYQFMNHAWQNPRGNLNGASFGSTLRFSRLADKLNNRLRYVPSPNVTMGTAQTGFTQAGGATLERWPFIETEETRLMEANRRLDERARQLGVDLQGRIQGYPQDYQELQDRSVLGLENDILGTENQTGRFWQQLVLTKEYGGSVEQFFKKDFQRFLTNWGLNKDARLADYIINTLAPWAAQVYVEIAGLGGTVPTKDVRALEAARDFIWSNPNLSSDQKAASWVALCVRQGITSGKVMLEVAKEVLTPKQAKDVQNYLENDAYGNSVVNSRSPNY